MEELRLRLDLPTIKKTEEPEPASVVVATPAPTPELTSEVPSAKKLSPMEARAEMDAIFADDFRAGRATDSCGNRFDGTNDRWPLQEGRADEAVSTTLIGPRGREKPAPQDGASHIHPHLRGDHQGSWDFDKDSLGTTRHGSSLAKGLDQAAYDEMMGKWRFGKSEREKAEAFWNRTAPIRDTWPKKETT